MIDSIARSIERKGSSTITCRVTSYKMFANLHDLAGKGNLEGVQKFLRTSAAKVNKTNRDGQTALHLAARG